MILADSVLSFSQDITTNLRIFIGDSTLALADSSGAIFVDPNLLCSRLLVKLSIRLLVDILSSTAR